MPSFDYTAIDRQGNTVKGQVQAANRDEAALSLTRTGLLVAKLDEAATVAQPAAIRQTSIPAASPPVLKSPQPRVASPPLTSPKPAAQAPRRTTALAPIRTKLYTDKLLYLLFSQLQSYARSGQNPVQALSNLSNTFPREDYRSALKEAADAAKEGRQISDVF